MQADSSEGNSSSPQRGDAGVQDAGAAQKLGQDKVDARGAPENSGESDEAIMARGISDKDLNENLDEGNPDKKVLVIVGATGVGKSKLGVELALKLGGEVVNTDAVQMYRGLDISSAKLTKEEMEGVPHHVINILDHNQYWTVKDYRNYTLPIIEDIIARGKLPILVGGTLYYLQSLLWPALLDASNNADDNGEEGDEEVKIPDGLTPHQYLQQLDPERADHLHPRDERKVLRSIHITVTSGRPHSEILKELKESGIQDQLRFRTSILWLQCKRHVHKDRIDRRVEDMLQRGVVEEAVQYIEEHNLTDKLMANDPSLQHGQFQAIGFKEFLPFLRASKNPTMDPIKLKEIKQECMSLLQLHHMQYSKYQTKWINKRLLPRNAPVFGLPTDRYEQDPSSWKTDVLDPSLKICEWLMSSKSLANTEPEGISKLNKTIDSQQLTTHYCKACHVTIVGDTPWKSHLGSHRHRRRTRDQNKRKSTCSEFAELVQAELQREQNGGEAPKSPSSPSRKKTPQMKDQD